METLRVDIVEAIDAKVEASADQQRRPHLGASEIGKQCERAIYMNYRWFAKPEFSGRMLRLFQRGHEEEAKLVELLGSVGIKVQDIDPSTGEQWHVVVNDALSGSMDGVAEWDGEKFVVEFKTHGDKSFTKLKKEGVQGSKPEHFAQMQSYMGATGIDRALYVAINKNTDELYISCIKFNEDIFNGLKDKASRVVYGWSMPPISHDPKTRMSPCKFCDYHDMCFGEQEPAKSCRTCIYASVKKGPVWFCTKHDNKELSTDEQRKACTDYNALSVRPY